MRAVPPRLHRKLRDREWGGALSDCVRVPYADGMLVGLPAGLEAKTVIVR